MLITFGMFSPYIPESYYFFFKCRQPVPDKGRLGEDLKIKNAWKTRSSLTQSFNVASRATANPRRCFMSIFMGML